MNLYSLCIDRRAQEYLSDSVSASGTSDDEDFLEAEEPTIEEEDGETAWDEDLTPGPSGRQVVPNRRPFLLPQRSSSQATATLAGTPSPPTLKAEERTPLLRTPTDMSYLRHAEVSPPKTKIISGHSTYGQTLFNAIAILLGIGMLSEPLAFAYAGWIGGTAIIIFYGWITCYTAKILAHIILDDPKLRSYSDIGKKAFGPRSGPWISAVFCLELFTVSVALVTLYADSLYAVAPTYSPDTYKLLGLIVLIPTMILPLSVLSYTSILGILSTLLIIAVMVMDGLSKPDSPGSLWEPAPTSLGIRTPLHLGLAFGLFMAGFSGHAVVPSLVRDMIDPTQFDAMITQAFTVATGIYGVIGVAGYLMFGDAVSEEFSQDLAKYSPFPVLNRIALWGLVLAPLSKYALATRPVGTSTGRPTSKHNRTRNGMLTAVERALFTLCSVAVSIFVPDFSSMMAFLGAFSSFLLCVIGPVSAKIALAGRCGWWDGFLLVTGIIMATWGTIASFWSMQ
ncbi:transmembrane amino acid transporter protein-domain-containing protein [Fomitopsis serialis]|uniref:transmembrane amino acid transporter protein-domain-containing protein n=1 Tax=Fomitopsis serialis TaxID=139415 RepID=UPI002007F2EF|nr:transmembrane amino acid transporter protein-domain-containing protein [Neoantrodia serialis]KAH9937611.1 transmembrane amino acid transporter protein-domain-containing protein [Neoantrodia serialis]